MLPINFEAPSLVIIVLTRFSWVGICSPVAICLLLVGMLPETSFVYVLASKVVSHSKDTYNTCDSGHQLAIELPF